MSRLEKLRSTLDGDTMPGCTDFVVVVRGGKSVQSTQGRPYDAIAGEARGAAAADFCRRKVGQESVRFDIAFGEATAATLARAWVHKMQFFWDLERSDSSLVAAPFSPAVLATYDESTDFTALELGASKTLLARISQVRAFLR